MSLLGFNGNSSPAFLDTKGLSKSMEIIGVLIYFKTACFLLEWKQGLLFYFKWPS